MDRKDARSGECPKILPLSQFSSDAQCIINEGVVSEIGVSGRVGLRGVGHIIVGHCAHRPPCTRDG